jgi:hypothetical protein
MDNTWIDVAWNPNTPAGALTKLAEDENASVRCGAAWHRNTPVEALIRLASDSDWDVRRGVSKNPNTPELVKLFLRDGYAGLTLDEFITGLDIK